VEDLERIAGLAFVAFCGIGRPEQFFSGLSKAGIKIGASRSFPDHHRYSLADMEALRQLAESTGSKAMVTTAKDLYRLGGLAAARDGAAMVFAVDLRVVLADETGIVAWLKGVLESARNAQG